MPKIWLIYYLSWVLCGISLRDEREIPQEIMPKSQGAFNDK